MKVSIGLIFMIVVGICNVTGTLYGIITDLAANGTQTVVWTVQVDPVKGTFTKVAENLVYVGSSASYDGIASYDQQKNYLYYSSDFDASFVYGVDIAKGEILPPVSINSESVNSIEWDGKNQQLLILGEFADQSSAVYTFPYTGSSVELINFTAQGISAPQTTYLDWAKGIYYFIYSANAGVQFKLGSFPISSPKSIQTTALNCGSGFSPDFLFLDSTSNVLFGVGYDSDAKTTKYYTIKDTTCSLVSIGLTGITTAATYDPTSRVLYLGFVDQTNTLMVTLNVATQAVISQVPVQRTLEDLQVSYKV
eukprot:Phypoly_transcript_04362.p1 GENE.Phypoly_transcript_04362~~Phypoly_transcript_04362.p1  ORF type:complete len:308 (+),score=37.74 Phypoly_transcript_04362:1240-2163(+)